ncbi:MAG TPA: acetate kinase [Firmicutes bacterium]|uniref:Acetate kinase n=1 Tax=Capillibacterium thermochitinicola TaxID=2699427 RepID=A0A8J6HZE3_9FIRM|nr:acetate kinase [Capillibacterium thermochitinicola]MBA2132611.1 acetate kinase [Capillibacterium thermochitinicola]HHW13263.1 acetate kinase [Bacillota bacterium]
MNILVLNSGSSSLKYKLFSAAKEEVLAHGLVERIGMPGGLGKITHQVQQNGKYEAEEEISNHQQGLRMILNLLTDEKWGVLRDLKEIGGVGHRVLHGGEYFKESILVTPEELRKMEELVELGPLHMPANLMGIKACAELMPGVPQVAVFDTAFHQTMPKKAYLYALPYELYEKYRVRRYGFHGTSHRYVSGQAAKLLGCPLESLKMITAHLGNGSSLAAIDGGKVIDTSMGLTPLEGLVMGTRSGDLDPAIVPLIGSKLKLTPEQADEYLNKKSGFVGMTGYSDMRDIQRERQAGNLRAQEAYDLFIYRIVKYIGAYMTALKGLDVLVFTAGIGENDWQVRADICRELEFLGVKMDYEKNEGLRGKETILSLPDSKVKVLLVPTNEELVIARDTMALIS